MPHDEDLCRGIRFAVDKELSKGELRILSVAHALDHEGINPFTSKVLKERTGMSAQFLSTSINTLKLKGVLRDGKHRGEWEFVPTPAAAFIPTQFVA